MCDLEDRVSSDPVMKKLALTGLATALLTSTALAGTIRVENHDSKTYKVELKCSGSSMTPGAEYFFRVRVQGAAGNSPWSDITKRRAS